MPETDLTVTADDGTSLAGTLSLPAGPGPHPAVLLLHGSGPLDREGNTPRLPLNLGRPLADALAAAGVAALRYDRRGAGSTPGVWEESGFTDNRRDASAALRALAAHPDIRPDAVGVVGHSEGALHAMTLAARQEVAAVVLLAGFARGGEAAFRWQAASVFGGMPAPVRLLRRPLGALGERVLARVKRTRTDVARIAGLRVNARWMREMLVHDTRDDLAAVPAAVPVLAVTGDKDVQVPPADLDEIRCLVPGGHTEIHRVPDLTHVLRRDTGRPTLRSYRRLLREPVDPELLALVATWLQARLREPSGALAEERRTTRS
ncbi:MULTISPECIES: alpha/beta hydrolase family protein [Streptomyces]|uniref:Alpha/beta hydrolase n=1 Tax=Streptomyces violaceoruber TaxID=1935 RepID=A0ACD4WQB0_STRVN|nr:alpha/beta hydrolase [Streptomyces sp. LRa12]THA98800.1 alpha/beta hydrolase [Streptomyces sp. LRa12]WOY99722.1 alpha/beta hydrolase [Streptomyces violaceoruber]BDD73072.1 acyl-CoA thioester hydrolase [Streptomyces coelicolor]